MKNIVMGCHSILLTHGLVEVVNRFCFDGAYLSVARSILVAER